MRRRKRAHPSTLFEKQYNPFPCYQNMWGPRQWAFYSNITSSKIFMQSLSSTCSTTFAKSSDMYHLSLKPYSYKKSCNSVRKSKMANMSVNHIMKRWIAEFHSLRYKTPLNTCTPLSKLTRILRRYVESWKLWLQKMAAQIWQNSNLKKWGVSAHWRIMLCCEFC